MLKNAFLDYLRVERGYSPLTLQGYGADLDEFEAFLQYQPVPMELHEANQSLVREWASLLMSRGACETTVNRKLSSLRSFYKYLIREGIISSSPMLLVHGPKQKKPLPVFVRDEDMDKLLDEVLIPDGTWQSLRERLIIEVFYETGMRLSELIGLDDSSVDFGRKVISVIGKRNKQRLIPVGDALLEELQTYLLLRNQSIERSTSALFVTDKGNRLYAGWVYRLVREDLGRVVTLKKKSPHVLRHTFATSMLNNHAELEAVKELLGHESVGTTQIYTHTTFEELRSVYKQAHPRAK